ncbi:T9SS type A sorting domain-containing protein [bacterium]|nr:T9SS type A sorting domain-containing protein [bacterium]
MLGVDIWVACYNQGLALGLDAIPPVSANNPEMPATMYITTDGGRRFEEFHQSDYMCQATYSIRERGCLLTIEPETLDFGDDLIVGREYSIEALFSSFGDDTVAIHAIQMPMNAEDYLSVEPTEFVIPPDEEVIVTVTFSTEEPVELVSRLRVLNNSDNIDNAFIWDVYATASEEQPEGRQLRIEPELLDFGDNLSPGEEYTINAVFSSFGDETVTINRIRISGDGEDYLTVDPTEFEIEPGSEQVVTVIFRSDEPGEYNLRILVVNDSQNMDNVFQWDVIAVVIDEVPEGRHLSIEPDALDFGDSLEIDQEYSIEAVFSSFGDEAVTITEIIPPDNAADYLTIDPNGEFVLEPDSDRIVIVTFASEEPVELDIDLRVMHNAENIHQPCLWHLSAAIPEEVPRGLRYRPESLNFGNDLRPGREYIIVAIFTTYDEMVRVRAITIPQEYRDCLSVEPSSFVIEAEDIMEVTVTFRSDEPVVLDSSLFIISDADNLPENQPWPIRAVCSEGVPEGPHLRIEPDPLEFGDDLLIGLEYSIDAVFTSFGDETVTIWDIQIPHAGRNCLTVEPDQLEIPPGEERTVTVTFDSDEAVEIDSHMRIINNAVNLADVYLWHVSAVSSGEDYEVTVPMLDRWNLISINVVPPDSLWLRREGPDVILMTERLRDEEDNHRLFLIKDEEGQFYIPEYGYCSIPYWDLTEGFLVNVLEDVEPSWNGIQIPPSTDIPLEEGWNMVAYFPTYELDANRPDYYVLSNILDHLIIAKNGAGNFMYPGHNFSNMPPWREGQGYKINVDSDVVLNYPRQQDENAVTIPQLRDEHSGVTVTPYNMSVLLIDVSGIGYVEGRTVRAFRADGFKVGEGEMDIDSRCGLAVYGDDPETDYIEGLSEGELFELRLYDQLSCVDAILKPGMFIRGKKLVYENDGILVMEAEIQAVVPDKFDLFTNYPNPFNSSTRLDFILKEKADVRLSVWDTSGRMLNVIINGRLDAGSQCATWSVHDMPSGIYVFLLEVNGGRYVTKGVLIR